ncbi:MAG: hypothetical protein AB7O24_11195 [Kofleriaceae bacterium]
MSYRLRSALAVSIVALSGPALADQQAPPAPAPSAPQPYPQPVPQQYPQAPATPQSAQPQAPGLPQQPASGAWAPAAVPASSTPAASMPGPGVQAAAPPAEEDKTKKKQPKPGDFDAGGQARFPNGPDEMGKYASFNWVAVDLKGKYVILEPIQIYGNIPLAVKKPDTVGGVDPKLIGGMSVTLDVKLPTGPFVPKNHEMDVGLQLTGAYMREGAMLLSEKDFPMFQGDFKPGFAGGLRTKIKMSSLVDFALTPSWVYQSGSMESQTAVQIPMSLILGLGSLLKVSADLGVYTGDDYSFGASNGGRISAGGALDIKVGPVIAHAGMGVASLLSGGMYPTIGDSVYVDVNVKYAK